MPFKFEKLVIWNLAVQFANNVHSLTRQFPREEMYSLSSQFKRASDSIALNIAEGSIGQSNPEQRRFIGYAIRSSAECVTCLYLAKMRAYINESEFEEKYQELEILFAMMNKYRKRLEPQPENIDC